MCLTVPCWATIDAALRRRYQKNRLLMILRMYYLLVNSYELVVFQSNSAFVSTAAFLLLSMLAVLIFIARYNL